MAKLKLKRPPLYMPSSGSMVSVKLRMSSGLGKCVFIVVPRESSSRSEYPGQYARKRRGVLDRTIPFCARSWAGVTFFFLLVAAAAASSSACFFFCIAVSHLRFIAAALVLQGTVTYHRPYFHHLGGIVKCKACGWDSCSGRVGE